MARNSKLSTLMRQIITTPLGTAAVHHAAISPQGIARVKTDTKDVLIFTRDGGRDLKFTDRAKRKSRP